VQPKAVSAPPPDPTVVKKERLKSNRNFDSDSDTEPDRQRSRESRNLSKLEQRVAAAEKDAAARRRAPEAQRALLLQQQQQQQAYQSPYSSSGKAVASKGRTVLPKGKADAASRNMALAPQVVASIVCWSSQCLKSSVQYVIYAAHVAAVNATQLRLCVLF